MGTRGAPTPDPSQNHVVTTRLHPESIPLEPGIGPRSEVIDPGAAMPAPLSKMPLSSIVGACAWHAEPPPQAKGSLMPGFPHERDST